MGYSSVYSSRKDSLALEIPSQIWLRDRRCHFSRAHLQERERVESFQNRRVPADVNQAPMAFRPFVRRAGRTTHAGGSHTCRDSVIRGGRYFHAESLSRALALPW